MPGELRTLVDRLGARVAAAWGEEARYDLEVRAGLLPELAAERARVGREVFAAAVRTLCAGRRPRVIAQALLAELRRAPTFERQVVVTGDYTVERPAANLSAYHRRLLGAACGPAGEVQ